MLPQRAVPREAVQVRRARSPAPRRRPAVRARVREAQGAGLPAGAAPPGVAVRPEPLGGPVVPVRLVRPAAGPAAASVRLRALRDAGGKPPGEAARAGGGQRELPASARAVAEEVGAQLRIRLPPPGKARPNLLGRPWQTAKASEPRSARPRGPRYVLVLSLSIPSGSITLPPPLSHGKRNICRPCRFIFPMRSGGQP